MSDPAPSPHPTCEALADLTQYTIMSAKSEPQQAGGSDGPEDGARTVQSGGDADTAADQDTAPPHKRAWHNSAAAMQQWQVQPAATAGSPEPELQPQQGGDEALAASLQPEQEQRQEEEQGKRQGQRREQQRQLQQQRQPRQEQQQQLEQEQQEQGHEQRQEQLQDQGQRPRRAAAAVAAERIRRGAAAEGQRQRVPWYPDIAAGSGGLECEADGDVPDERDVVSCWAAATM